MCKDLFFIKDERLKYILELSQKDFEDICICFKRCNKCPLAIVHLDNVGIKRYSCAMVMSAEKTEDILKKGGKFNEQQ